MASLRSAQSTVVVLAALAAAASLTGCGGNAGASASDYKPRAGDPFYLSVQVDGIPVQEETYRFYGVDTEGNLSSTPVENDEALPHVALLEKATTSMTSSSVRMLSTAEPLPLSTLKAFYKELWAAEKAVHPTYGPQELALHIGDLNAAIEELYRDVEASDLNVGDYVVFYAAANTAWPDDPEADERVRDFLESVAVSPGAMVGILGRMGWNWNGLLAKMVAEGTSFDDLYDAFERSPFATLEEFLPSHLEATPPQAPRFEAASGASGLDIAKFAWDVIKDGRPVTETSGAMTRVLSEKDTSWEHYERSMRGETPVVTIQGWNMLGMTMYKARFHLSGYYAATNPSFGGKWLPSVAFTVDEAYTFWTWWLNASAIVLHPVNMGTADSPVPQIEVEAKVRGDGLFRSETKTVTFLANGESGFSVLSSK